MLPQFIDSLAERFWSKVDKDGPLLRPELGPCWKWRAALSQKDSGYGVIGLPHSRKTIQAHRLSWILHYGVIPEGLWVLHKCDNPSCSRPEHLYLGSPSDNSRDMADRGRAGPQLYPEQYSGENHWSRKHPESYRRGENHPWHLHPELVPRGEQAHKSSLTEDDVRAIRAAPTGGKALAAEYGVSVVTLSDIRRRKTWTHI